MIRILVVDDEPYAREELSHQIREELPDAIVEEAASGAEAVTRFARTTYDILFMDIQMPSIQGITVAALARKLMPNAQIIFATAYSEYAAQAFELGVDNYILKPFDPRRVRHVLELCMKSVHQPYPTDDGLINKLAVRMNRHTTLLDIQDIVYIQTSGASRCCVLHTGEKRYTTTASLSSYEKRLQLHGFFRIHRTCLVQLRLIQDIFPWYNNDFGLRMQGFAETLPIGREHIKELKQRLRL